MRNWLKGLEGDVRRWFVVFAIAFGLIAWATQASAQTPPQADPAPMTPWTFGANFAPGSLVNISGTDQPTGSIRSAKGDRAIDVPQATDWLIVAHLAFQPDKGLGFGVQYLQFGTHSSVDGTAAAADGQLILSRADSTPHIVTSTTSDGILFSPVGYSLGSSAKVQRIDFLPSLNFGIAPGVWASVHAGPSVLLLKVTDTNSRKEEVLLFSKLQNGTRDSVDQHEIYTDTLATAMNAKLIGITGGLKGEYCVYAGPVRRWIIDGGVNFAMYPWGSGSLTGSYTPIKNAYTSTASAGFSGAPITRLLTDFDRHSAVYTDTVNQTVTMFDGSIGLKLRIRPREKKVAFDIGAAGMGLLMKNTPRPPLYTISDGFAPGNGTFSHQSADITARALMFTLAISR